MEKKGIKKNSNNQGNFFANSRMVLVIISVIIFIFTFFIANSDFSFGAKVLVFALIVALYLIYSLGTGFVRRRAEEIRGNAFEKKISEDENIFSDELENKLLALEEAGVFFGTSLKWGDMFRLVSSRIDDMIPFAACALFMADEEKSILKINCVVGENAGEIRNLEITKNEGLAGKTFVSRQPQVDEFLHDSEIFPPGTGQNLNSACAVPLFRNDDVFGVLELFGNMPKQFDEKSLTLLEAIGERVAPLFLNSLAFEKNLTNALTDSLTNLPNERGFYLVLENQIAESQRYRNERPLTILAIDIKGFNELNIRYGHSTGDSILVFAAESLKQQLRQMDFLARSGSDEFLLILPTASSDTTKEIVSRIKEKFADKLFEVSEQEKFNIELNFGAAAFWQDGETANQLLTTAHLRKQQSKTDAAGKVIWFPQGK